MDKTMEDLLKARAPLMQYRRIKRLLQFVRDTSAGRAGEDAEAITATLEPEVPEVRKASRT